MRIRMGGALLTTVEEGVGRNNIQNKKRKSDQFTSLLLLSHLMPQVRHNTQNSTLSRVYLVTKRSTRETNHYIILGE